MKILIIFLIPLLIGCKPKHQERKSTLPPEEILNDSVAVDITNPDVYKEDKHYDYRQLFGIYDHESTTAGFSAVISLSQYGNDIYFTVSVYQGDCKGESEGVITIMDHTERYYTGFHESDECRMQFSFIYPENKIDIKEITLCSHHGNNCSFEGTYVKRKN